MNEKKDVLFVLPNGEEYFMTLPSNRHHHDYKSAAETALRENGYKTHRNEPQTVRVDMYTLEIKAGKLVRLGPSYVEATPPLMAMTEEEYNAEMKGLLSEVPEAFREYVSNKAWQDGHANGYEEVVNHAQSMVYELKPVIEKYTADLKLSLIEKKPRNKPTKG
jgi:flagellar biosynthesis/type III secretory pathway protein FliH